MTTSPHPLPNTHTHTLRYKLSCGDGFDQDGAEEHAEAADGEDGYVAAVAVLLPCVLRAIQVAKV